MKIAVIGGGPAGLYFSALMKQLDPGHEIAVFEQNRADDTFGFGVVFSDETLGGIENADRVVYEQMEAHFARWTDIDVYRRGMRKTVGGQGFAAMNRHDLLSLLQRRCLDLGVDVRFATRAPDVAQLMATHDLVLAADGLNSGSRARFARAFAPDLDPRYCKYMWLGTDKIFEAFTFIVEDTEWGVMQIHGYPYSDYGSTFIVEMADDVWRRAGFDAAEGRTFKPGENDEQAIARIGEIFSDYLGDSRILANNSQWITFTTVRNKSWVHENLVLLGDAAHTAHFSIGSGTKLAMEDALSLAACLQENADLATALEVYEQERRPIVESTQRAAQASLEWFETIGTYQGQDDVQFTFNLLTRSRRITFDNLRLRDSEFAEEVLRAFSEDTEVGVDTPAMFTPITIGGLRLKNRIVVSPMDMYSAVDGMPSDFHLMHLGSKALGGAGLVMTEMVCVAQEGRITPGCAGIYTPDQGRAWRRIVDAVHESSTAKIGLQIGHSGRKGSTKLMWEGIDDPLDDGNWEVIGPSALPYGPGSATPREMTRADMDRVVAQFADAARSGADAGFDLLEFHAGHGYLISAFLSPISNTRTDEYGGSVANRLRFPLEVFDAVRAGWRPGDRPVSVRLSATDWIPDGNDIEEALAIARAFCDHGVDLIDVSTGQVAKHEQPAYGRSYQTPYADRIRNEIAGPAGVKVIAVGAISTYDDVNSILLAGRADLCALGRAHLYDPHWTLHAAADQEYTGPGADWPNQFKAGDRKPPSARTDAVRPRLALLREDSDEPPTHVRWTP